MDTKDWKPEAVAAVVAAAVARLRPIVMTKLTCIAGLIPLLLFAGSLWTGMAVTIMGGLLLGTLITLGLVPVLYELLFSGRIANWADRLTGSAKTPEAENAMPDKLVTPG